MSDRGFVQGYCNKCEVVLGLTHLSDDEVHAFLKRHWQENHLTRAIEKEQVMARLQPVMKEIASLIAEAIMSTKKEN